MLLLLLHNNRIEIHIKVCCEKKTTHDSLSTDAVEDGVCHFLTPEDNVKEKSLSDFTAKENCALGNNWYPQSREAL